MPTRRTCLHVAWLQWGTNDLYTRSEQRLHGLGLQQRAAEHVVLVAQCGIIQNDLRRHEHSWVAISCDWHIEGHFIKCNPSVSLRQKAFPGVLLQIWSLPEYGRKMPLACRDALILNQNCRSEICCSRHGGVDCISGLWPWYEDSHWEGTGCVVRRGRGWRCEAYLWLLAIWYHGLFQKDGRPSVAASVVGCVVALGLGVLSLCLYRCGLSIQSSIHSCPFCFISFRFTSLHFM